MTRKWKAGLLAFFTLVLLLIAASAILRMNTKKHSPVDKISYSAGDLEINLVYCQPMKKGRVIFGEAADGALQPWGKYWRLGANEATTIEFTQQINFAGEPLPAGKYSVYAVPGEKTWKIGVNSDANRWGYSEPDYDKDVLNIQVPVSYSNEVVEMFTMTFEEIGSQVNLVMKWDTSIISIPLK